MLDRDKALCRFQESKEIKEQINLCHEDVVANCRDPQGAFECLKPSSSQFLRIASVSLGVFLLE
jgi:hypothetical protein